MKIVLERRAAAGGAAALEAWIRAMIRSAEGADGLEGASVLASGTGDYFILLRFRSAARLGAWQSSDSVQALLADGDRVSLPLEPPVIRTGLETWFTLPGHAVGLPPPKWKMALVTWSALLPQAYLLGLVIPHSWPRLAGVAVGTALPVAALTWFVMPNLVKQLHRWLHAGEG